jgi:hypothetical protein
MLPGHRGNSSAEHEKNVLTQSRKLLMLAYAKSFTKADQQQQRSHTPGHAKHSEE